MLVITSLIFLLLGTLIKNKIFSKSVILSGLFSTLFWLKPEYYTLNIRRSLDYIFAISSLSLYLWYCPKSLIKSLISSIAIIFFILSHTLFRLNYKSGSFKCHLAAHIVCIIGLLAYIHNYK